MTPGNPFKGRHNSGEVILLAVRCGIYDIRWRTSTWLRCWLKRALEVDAICVGDGFRPMRRSSNKPCWPHLRPTNKSYRIDETIVH
jgi:hypothetical protein